MRALGLAGLFVAIMLAAGFTARAQTPEAPRAEARTQIVKQQQRTRARRAGQEFDDCSGAAWCPRMVVIPAGSFTMGSADIEDGRQSNEGPQRQISVAQFAVAKFEVTWDQWQACVDRGGCSAQLVSDAGFGRGNHPVINVSWNNANQYVAWLSRDTQQTYRLLTEAEWEYAARATTQTRYPWGDDPSHEHANYGSDACCDAAILGRDQWLGSAPVGSFPANPFGLHDMHGNVWEWVQDCYVASYADAPIDAPANAANCRVRVDRGGSWSGLPRATRSAYRNYAVPADRVDSIGFRVARTLN